jgi:hypothetical protein
VLDGIARLNHGGDQPCDLGRLILSKAKFGGMTVPAAQLDLGRPFQENCRTPSTNAAKYSFVRTALILRENFGDLRS